MKKFKRILSCIFVLVFLLSTFSGIAVTAASVVYNDGDTAGLPVKPDGVIHRTANRLAWSQSNGKILTGTYTFLVKATNNDGVWSKNEAKLKIVVHPPFWWTECIAA